jgi:hypothetical protein
MNLTVKSEYDVFLGYLISFAFFQIGSRLSRDELQEASVHQAGQNWNSVHVK